MPVSVHLSLRENTLRATEEETDGRDLVVIDGTEWSVGHSK
jgi:hypothetical protein